MKLKKLEVNAFGGINPQSPLVITWLNGKFVTLKGDQGTRKSSLEYALLMALGALGSPDSKDNKRFINNESGKIDINMDFVGNDRFEYKVRCTKSSFLLTYEGENVPEPLTQMRKLSGVVGVSPMEIKNKPIKEILKWLAGYSTKNVEDFEKQTDKLKVGIKSTRETRAAANKSAKGLIEYLNGEELYINWEQSEKKYKKSVDIKDLSAKLDAAGKASDKFLQAETRMKDLVFQKERINQQIEKLMIELEQTDKAIEKGLTFIEENKGVKNAYEAVRKEYDHAATESVAYNKWQDIKRKKTELDDFETISQDADAKEKQLLKELRELQAEILPDIKGVSIVTEDTHENGVMVKEGLYVGKLSSAQLSETEWWDFVMQVWMKNGVKIIVIDNMQSLGSKGFERLQKLHDKGAYILAAEMNREKKELEIIYE